ncbi:CrcB family protein [Plesiomonas shigelloides]|uniref:CrcB family protein n=1 Tax=Plesiomonas shigelloides TaxID=703 RepID=UPI00387EF470
MINLVILIFVGGAFGAMCREFFMLGFPTHAGDFPLAIFLANVLASFLLGLSTGSRQRLRIHEHVHQLVGTGIMGGMSTFSSFVYAAVTLVQNPATFRTALCYIAASLLAGLAAAGIGTLLGQRLTQGDEQEP